MSTVERKMQVRPKKGRAAPFLMGLLRFLVVAVTTYLGLLAVTFFIGRVIPIDPALAIAGDHAPTQVLERLRREMHLDQPLYLQFYYYLLSALSGDFGISVLTTNPVMDDIKRVFPATMELATVGTIIGAVFGVPFGVLAAVRRNSFIDQIVRVVGLVGYSVPVFWLAMVSLVIFYAKLNWVAYPGRIDIAFEYTFTPITGFFLLDSVLQGQWDVFWDVFRHIILPASLLGYFSLAYISRMTRSFMLNELGQEYIVAARAKGLSETRVIWGHALRSAAVPLITVIALSYAGLLEGSVLTEIVFSWPGIGFYITSSLRNADMNAVLGGTIVVGTVFIGINLISDLLYRTLDPRTRRK
ncbi:ABC transporter permease subunit [Rhizobium lusitanum]|uniref:ABC transporter permease subunit n=1 Tax=Rhizobium lusitanum TaxID=293958 RepID=A0A6L9U8G4_9HYPH|nr:ABC transporter permease [Rhizobium lusitanum]NEI70798.1 ABC transporter permease subunit [Rhizobium lusitanum]